MLVIARQIGEVVEIVHTKSGDVMRISLREKRKDAVHFGFDDPDRNFEIRRTELPKFSGRPIVMKMT